MAIDFCSAPATSVDAERAFSVGRRQINFMQHNTSSNTFRAKMAVGSWDGTPLFPNINDAISILNKKMSSSNSP
ncbi:uncharacterized protein FOMMEDRAFT_95472 [Fomitiporia mediterranea MF3/22]|uniref:uncharacterized protein n=1 Tax=Fomitiporia mediterranea (strain MF3/22) TaxID=694068 RepID=UPI0004409B27|nr:uncharacterized protein FOMMEDRAFT_95472 [Fomitiporia mediterranea MF3/22]EJC99009.1 hypothetical protein FOMMEDRAFT_95472 [Fomitiporia mediterranea MF3/22]